MFGWSLQRRALALGALALAANPALRAQAAPPAVPDTIPLAGAGAPGYLRSIHEAAAPMLVAQHPYRVMLAPAATAASLDAVDMLTSLKTACLMREPLSPPESYTPGGIAVDATKYFVVIVSSASSAQEECRATWNASAFGIWSGLTFAGRNAAAGVPPRALRLLADGVPVEPALSVARPLLELDGTEWRRGGTQLRYYYPMSALVTSASGRRPGLVVQVFDSRAIATSFDVSPADGERLQFAYAVWRVASSGGTGRPVRLTPRRPVAPEVRAALALAATTPDSGALRAAELLARSAPTPATAYERDVATMLVAEALGQRGDSVAERALVASVRDGRNCLVSPQGASPSLAAIVAASRTRPCPEHNTLATLGAGVVIPGGGHWMNGSKLFAAVATAAVSSIYLTAFRQDMTARDAYAEYEESHLVSQAPGLYDLANKRRATARRMAQIGVAVSLTDAVIATFVTALQNREVSRGRL